MKDRFPALTGRLARRGASLERTETGDTGSAYGSKTSDSSENPVFHDDQRTDVGQTRLASRIIRGYMESGALMITVHPDKHRGGAGHPASSRLIGLRCAQASCSIPGS